MIMSYISDRYASQGNDWRHRYGLPTTPYLMNDQHAYPALTDSWIFPGTWANYNNAKSGKYNRRTCWKCENAVGGVQSPGVYPLHPGPPAAVPQINPEYVKDVNRQYEAYQKVRMCNGGDSNYSAGSSSCGGIYKNPPGYSNYHDKRQWDLYPKQYVYGTWPSEQQDVTRTPDGHVYGENLGVIDC